MSGAYSNQYKVMERQREDQTSAQQYEERSDVLARSRKLSAQTARRRKALAIKRKAEAQREEKRRQEILQKRREQIRDATERFQRGNLNYGKPKDDISKLVKSSTPTLEEALAVVRGGSFGPRASQSGHFQRATSANNYTRANRSGVIHYHGGYTADNSPGQQHTGYSNGYAQNTVYASPQNNAYTQYNGYNQPSNQQQSNGLPNGYANANEVDHAAVPPPAARPSRITSAGSVRSASSTVSGNRQYTYKPMARAASANQSRTEAAHRAQLQNHSLRNLASSRSLFEQQLEQHQQLLLEEQKESLHHFNAAIQQEMDRDPRLQGIEEDPTPTRVSSPDRVGSPDSVDSLETGSPCQETLEPEPASHGIIISTQQPQAGPTQTTHIVHTENNQPMRSHQDVQRSSVGSAFVLHSLRSSQSPIAVVQPQVIQRNNASTEDVQNKQNSNINKQLVGQVTPNHQSQSHQIPTQQVQGQQIKNHLLQDQQLKNQQFQDQHMKDQKVLEQHMHVQPNPGPPTEDGSRVAKGDQIESHQASMHPLPGGGDQGFDSKNVSSAYNVIKTNTNGRYNGHFYQDSVVNYVHDLSSVSKGALEDNVAGYDGKNPVVLPSSHAHSIKAWVTPPPQDNNREFSYGQAPSHGDHTKKLAPEATPTYPNTQTQTDNGTFTVVHSMKPSTAMNNNISGTPKASGAPTQTGSDAPSSGRQQVAMEMLKQYSQQPMFRVVEPEPEDKHSVQSDTSTLVSDVAEESQPEPEPKSILRKVSSYSGTVPSESRGSASRNLHLGGSRIITRVKSANASLKDSVEVAKQRREETPPPKRKKSVRFADLTYDEEESDKGRGEKTPAAAGMAPSPLDHKGPPSTVPTAQKPPRPASAHPSPVVTTTSPPSKIPRASSAGTVRRGPFLRPHPPAHPPTGRAAVTRNNNNSSNSNNSATTTNSPPTGEHNPKKYAVYDANGMRLDRTPTDEEINFLWEKVRTCLSRQSVTSTISSIQQPENNNRQSSATAAPSTAMSQKYIDGNALAPQFRVATRLNNTYTNNYMGTTTITNNNTGTVGNGGSPQRKKVSMDTLNSYTRRAGLLNQRSKQTPPTTLSGTAPYVATTTTHTISPYKATEAGRDTNHQEVTESMAAFLTAENLAVQSASESEIEVAMENARVQQQAINSANPTQKVPTALSIEEQRLMQSLERLNERLKLNETNMYPSTNYVPNPPPQKPGPTKDNKPPQDDDDITMTTYTQQQCVTYGGGFKGRQPLTSAAKRQANSNGTVPRHSYRGMAATVVPSGGYSGGYRYR